MNKNTILFIGIGQAGNNLVSEVLKTDKRYNGLFINTSYDDLKLISNAKNIYIVPGAGGTGKNRDLAKRYVKEYIYGIIDKIDEFPMQDTIYIAFSMAGGTGSGISPILIKLLGKLRPNLTINIIPILPFSTDSKKALGNTLECWNELITLNNINTIYMLDNNQRETKMDINTEFSYLFNLFMNSTNSHPDGVIDSSEITLLSSAKGFSGIYMLSGYTKEDDEDDIKESLSSEVNFSIFAGVNSHCKYLGLSLTNERDMELMLNTFSPSIDYFIGYNNDAPLIMISGSELNNGPMKEIQQLLDNKNSKSRNIFDEDNNKSLELDISKNKIKPVKSKSIKKEQVIDVKNIDEVITDNFWEDILNI